jgi:putative oxidoreductase
MTRWLGRFSPYCYALLRIVAGLMFALHGTQKLFGWPIPGPPGLTPLLKAAAIIEMVGGLMIALGFLAGYAAFICSGEMAVAYFMMHAPHGFWPLMGGGNSGEPAVLYCFIFLYIASHGSGVWSIDALRGVRRS